MCGHATLASAYVLLNFYHQDWKRIIFSSQSGMLTVNKKGDLYEMDFPAYELRPVPVTEQIAAAGNGTWRCERRI